jgi:hypothetical protein
LVEAFKSGQWLKNGSKWSKISRINDQNYLKISQIWRKRLKVCEKWLKISQKVVENKLKVLKTGQKGSNWNFSIS